MDYIYIIKHFYHDAIMNKGYILLVLTIYSYFPFLIWTTNHNNGKPFSILIVVVVNNG